MSLNGLGELMTAVGLAGLLWAEATSRPKVRAVTKTLASAGFIVAAFGFGALESQYGQTILVGLVLGAIGDVCLLGDKKPAFIAGLVAFLLGHIAYVLAFSSLDQDPDYAIGAAIAVTVSFIGIARWVLPHAKGLGGAIIAYMVVIGAMVVTAVGAFGMGAPWMIPVGAVMFAVSDIFVVRHRFVTRGFVNKAFGLPLYFAAQLLIAWSIAAVAAQG